MSLTKLQRGLNCHPQEKFVRDFPWLWVIIHSLFPKRWKAGSCTITAKRFNLKSVDILATLTSLATTNSQIWIHIRGYCGSTAILNASPLSTNQPWVESILASLGDGDYIVHMVIVSQVKVPRFGWRTKIKILKPPFNSTFEELLKKATTLKEARTGNVTPV